MVQDIYKALYSVLSADATFTALVSATNIRSTLDTLAPGLGNAFVYALDGVEWDYKLRRGSATLRVQADASANKAAAHSMVNRFFEIVTARSISRVSGMTVAVSRFREIGPRTDGVEENGYWQVSTNVELKLVQV